MARIPVNNSVPELQAVVKDLNQQISDLQNQIDGINPPSKKDIQDLSKAHDDLQAQVIEASSFDAADVFRGSGGAHAIGLVPDPGEPAVVTGRERFLREDGLWKGVLTPFRVYADPTGAVAPDRNDKFNLLGNLFVSGALMASRFMTSLIRCYGNIELAGGHQLWPLQFEKAAQAFNPNGITATFSVPIWRAPYPCTAVKIQTIASMASGTVTVNAKKNALNLMSSDLSATVADTWYNSTSLQNYSFAVDDTLWFSCTGVGTTLTRVLIQVEFTRP